MPYKLSPVQLAQPYHSKFYGWFFKLFYFDSPLIARQDLAP